MNSTIGAGRPSHVWYLAYGSNLSWDRFRLYLEAGVTEPGARDPRAPTEDRWLELPFRLVFGRESQRWNGGGVAFVFPDPDHRAWFRAWRVTGEQFEDVFAQENRLPVGTPLPWNEIAESPQPFIDLTGRWYGRLHIIEAGVEPLLTFSSPASVPTNPPHADYRDTLANGLAANPALDERSVAAYLDTATGQ